MSEVTDRVMSLREWCRVTCAGYSNVEINNMSTSFRDGLAFCAIIHKHRPDLIDFRSLSKKNVYQNNDLAFQVAETHLGVPALLHPKEMASTKVPDSLSVITYLSQYYSVFNRKSPAAGSPVAAGFTSPQSATRLETDSLFNTRTQAVCNSCFMPVHLIQRHLVDGKFYHRNCFRCKVCRSTLLPEYYTQGSAAGSLICTHHITDRKTSHVDCKQQTENRPKCDFQADSFSFSGLAITSVPYYTRKTETQVKPVSSALETEGKVRQERSVEVKASENRDTAVGLRSMLKKAAPPCPPLPTDTDTTVEGSGKTGPPTVPAYGKIQKEGITDQQPPELNSPCGRATEGSSRLSPACRQMLDSSVVPVPAPTTKVSPKTNSCAAAGNLSNQSKSPSRSSNVTSPYIRNPYVRTNHPWMAIIHPGPWTQLPPAPAPLPTPRSKLPGPQYRPRVAPPNPFEEDMNKDKDTRTTVAEEASGSAVADPAEGVCAVPNTAETLRELSGNASQMTDETVSKGGSLPDKTEADAGPYVGADKEQGEVLPRSLSVPVITSSSGPVGVTESAASCQSKLVCKENPFDRKSTVTKSKSFQVAPSRRAPVPGNGFPLIKRKVQTDEHASPQDLQTEMRELDTHMEALQQRGVELEKILRDCKDAEEEEQMLVEWFSLFQEKQVLVRRDTELVYLSKQQNLEERQADVEYELRCILNKPEEDWSPEDRGREQQLMDELVAIIEQRDRIISSLDQDMQREREEDVVSKALVKSKESQKGRIKELKKSKGTFKPAKVFKLLNSKAQSTKEMPMQTSHR